MAKSQKEVLKNLNERRLRFSFTHSLVIYQTPGSATLCISNSELDRIKQLVCDNVV
jgi:hypothetical protein